MSTTNEHVGAEGRFWPAEHGAPANGKEPSQLAEDVTADARSAYEEASGRAERESEIHDDDIDSLAHSNGTAKGGLEYALRMTRAYKENPLAAREQHLRDYSKRFTPPRPEPEPPEQPPADLEGKGLHEWRLMNDVKTALRQVPRETVLKRQREDVQELLREAAKELGTTPGKLLQQASAVDQAMQVNPVHVSAKLSKLFGAPVSETHAHEIVAAHHVEQQEAAAMGQWIKEVEASGSLPGFEQQEVKSAMAAVIRDPSFQQTGSMEQDLVNAYSIVAQQVREYSERESAKAAAKEAKAAAEKARQASRSISGSAGSSMREKDVDGGDLDGDVRSAYRSLSGNRV